MSWSYAKPMLVLGFIALAQPLLAGEQTPDQTPGSERPNVLIFMLDDAGFGHLGSFGGAIETPHMDRVAQMGLRYTNFHTTAL